MSILTDAAIERDCIGKDWSMRKTKIIGTIGPASEQEEILRELMLAGMNVARFNFSHGTRESQKEKLDKVVRIREELGLPVASLMDTRGPEIRLGRFREGSAELKTGATFVLTAEPIVGDAKRASISYPDLQKDLTVGAAVLIDDGLIELRVEEIRGNEISCRVCNGGVVSDRKGVNVPGAVLSIPYLSETDREDILFGAELGFDFLAASFVRCREDVEQVRALLNSRSSRMKIIAKIENMQGIEHLGEILEAADGVMVARGDMGVEIPLEEVPVAQKKMIKLAIARGKHVITATQMLESMIRNPRPTRAEAADIANAIYDGTTAIMLSGESAAGRYPVEAVRTMAKIAESAECDIDYRGRMNRLGREQKKGITEAIAFATCTTAMDLGAAAIISVTVSGFTAAAISRYKPGCRIIGCTMDPAVLRQMNLLWGVTPLLMERKQDTEELFVQAVKCSKAAGLVQTGDIVVITAGVPLGGTGTTNMIRVVEVR